MKIKDRLTLLKVNDVLILKTIRDVPMSDNGNINANSKTYSILKGSKISVRYLEQWKTFENDNHVFMLVSVIEGEIRNNYNMPITTGMYALANSLSTYEGILIGRDYSFQKYFEVCE